MLYVTTRNDTDAFTAPRTLIQDVAADGGYYAPFRLPEFDEKQIAAFKDRTFGQNVALLLNHFFTLGIESWDVDFRIGRNPVKLVPISYKIIVAEAWHNPQTDYSLIIKQLYSRLCMEGEPASDWARIAIRIAVIFGIFGQLMANENIDCNYTVDVAVSTVDFTDLIAVWYGRKMGLPIGSIICGCSEADPLWDFIHKGELSTRNLSDSSQKGIERLVHCTLGCSVVRRFNSSCESGSLFSIDEEQRQILNAGLFTAVVSDKRTDSIISSVYKKNNYSLGADAVMPYGALQDHRARTGENRLTLICSDKPAA